MDRKTLFAFLLIAVIILITPAYYNLLYPPVESVDADSTLVETRVPVSKKHYPCVRINHKTII